MFHRIGALVLAAALMAAPAFADDSAETLLAQAKAAFDGRADLTKNQQAITLAEAGLAKNPTGDLKVDLLVIASRAYYWKGGHVDGKDAKMAAYGKGLDLAKAAIAVNDDYAEGYYYAAINLGRWAEAKGIFESLGRKDELINYAEGADARLTRDADAGEVIDSYGPSRTLGRVYFKLPGVAGGSHSKSIRYLEKAFKNGPENALNVVYYAETLADGSGAEKTQAKAILDDLLNNAEHPARKNAARAPETAEELNDARALRSKLGR